MILSSQHFLVVGPYKTNCLALAASSPAWTILRSTISTSYHIRFGLHLGLFLTSSFIALHLTTSSSLFPSDSI